MLKPEHFSGGETQLKSDGLSLVKKIDASVRDEYCLSIADKNTDRFTAMRGDSTVKINPRQTSAKTLTTLIEQASKGVDRWRHHITKRNFDRSWKRIYDSDSDFEFPQFIEGQWLIAVVYDGRNPVGYSEFEIKISKDKGTRNYQFKVDIEMIYVFPEFRGQGYGIDLSAASAMICGDVFLATYKAVPAQSSIGVQVEAEIHTDGGRLFADTVNHHLAYNFECVEDFIGRRPSIKLKEFEVIDMF